MYARPDRYIQRRDGGLQQIVTGGLLAAGRNCWRIERAERLAFFVDAAPYFSAVRAAIRQAKRSVFILGWDIDSRVRLVPQGANDGYPEELGAFLREVVRRERALRMYVLSWDFAMAFALDREWVPLYKLGLRTGPRPRLHFRLDDRHPVSGSHHQKVVVVDDRVAFVGGLDLTHGRWDTPEHKRVQPWRVDVRGRISRPNHDVQAIVDGGAAQALGELCRTRWRHATGDEPYVEKTALAASHDPWPREVRAEVDRVEVGIARTDPGFVDGKPVHEIRTLYLDAIAAARHTLYIENQYFTSSVLGAALAARLRQAEGPHAVVVSRLTEEGWLEARTMGALRGLLHRNLKAADAHGRYRLYYPFIPGLEQPDLLNVHSKVLVVDDELCTVGSANFNNRSMGYDTECNLVLEARGEERVRSVIAGLRNRLLAEHLATDAARVAEEIGAHASAIAAIEALRRPGRSLEPIDPQVPPQVESLLSASVLMDPERAAEPESLVQEFVPPELQRPMTERIALLALVLLALAALAFAWRSTGLHELVPMHDYLAGARSIPAAGVLGIFLLAGVLPVPMSLVIVATVVVFGPLRGGGYALVGTLASAALAYTLGRAVGRQRVRQIAGRQLNRVTRRFARGGMLAVAVLRLIPVAPFSLVSAVAGASFIPFLRFISGSALGVTLLIALIASFYNAVEAVLARPGPVTYATLVGAAAIVGCGAFVVWRRFRA